MARTTSQVASAQSPEKTKKFVLVVGSGVHGRTSSKDCPKALKNWSSLLDEVAIKADYPLANRLLPPSVRWEEMLLRSTQEESLGYRESKSTIEREEFLRGVVKEVIIDSAKDNKITPENARIFSNGSVAALVSLNFEASWMGLAPSQLKVKVPAEISKALKSSAKVKQRIHAPMSERESYRLYARDEKASIWFPNGHAGRKDSLRMGFRDFGLQAGGIFAAFNFYKGWERQVLGLPAGDYPGGGITEKQFEKLKFAYLENKYKRGVCENLADNWVTAVMLFDPIFLGVGMSPDEQGLWWLLHQRARNLARVPSARPPQILKICPPCIEAEYGRFLSGSHVLEPIWCRTWCEGWDTVEAILAGKRD